MSALGRSRDPREHPLDLAIRSHRLWLPKTPSVLKTQRFRAFVRSWWYLDELSFRRPFHSGGVRED